MVNKLSFYTALMLCIPLFVWATGWHWVNDAHLISGFDTFMYFLTESGSAPYALITCVVFMLWLMKLVAKRYSWLLVGAVCATSVIGTQAIKIVAKHTFAEPRPYVVQMMGGEAQAEQFYELSRDERAVLVAQHYQNHNFPLVVKHRESETGYSFPSGHTIFAVSWLLLFAGLLIGIRSQAVIFAQGFALVWAALMLISRLRFGMHYPIDLFISTLIAWIFHCILFIWIIPFAERFSLFKKRG
ncbi:phosphatase PAP2 family protein [Haemophilus parahaemolyticus]|uniref:phosphatase PAP2 family protein n=1 Tax=Haemophilus parahaemolyticus TaxID=735 RepID=UPI002491BEA6|nr:phosphatase PAP2 family protein [Haemophilus parahaemolyticus]